MSAKSALGIEIDLLSLRHAEKNALKNALDVSFTLHLSKDKIKKNSVVLMNMTLLDQIKFMKKNIFINDYSKCFITSGILKAQKNQYLEKTSEWGWDLIKSKAKDKWLGFIFSKSKKL